MSMHALTSWLTAALILAAAAANQAPAPVYQRQPKKFGDAVARFQVETRPGPSEPPDTAGVRLTGTLLLVLSVEGPAPVSVEEPGKLAEEQLRLAREAGVSGKMEGEPQTEALEGGRERWQVKFLLEPGRDSQERVAVAPFRFRVGDPPGDWHKVTWEPLPLRQRDITGIDPPPPQPGWATWLGRLVWVGLAVVAVALGLAAGQLLRRRAGRTPPLTPSQWARRELERIEGLRLPEAGEVERFHTEVSDVVRRYLEKTLRIRARRQTTAEFLEAMHRSPQLQPAEQTLLRDFLERCDLAKFARAVPSAEECREVVTMAREIIDRMSAARPQPPGAVAPSAG